MLIWMVEFTQFLHPLPYRLSIQSRDFRHSQLLGLESGKQPALGVE